MHNDYDMAALAWYQSMVYEDIETRAFLDANRRAIPGHSLGDISYSNSDIWLPKD